MRSSMGVPEAMREAVGVFVAAAGIGVEVVSSGECTVEVAEGGKGRACSLSRLYIGGWIGCGRAHVLAEKLGVRTRQMAKLLDFLNIKIRHCELGCFR